MLNGVPRVSFWNFWNFLFFLFFLLFLLFFINFFKIFKKITILPRVKLTSCHMAVTVPRVTIWEVSFSHSQFGPSILFFVSI